MQLLQQIQLATARLHAQQQQTALQNLPTLNESLNAQILLAAQNLQTEFSQQQQSQQQQLQPQQHQIRQTLFQPFQPQQSTSNMQKLLPLQQEQLASFVTAALTTSVAANLPKISTTNTSQILLQFLLQQQQKQSQQQLQQLSPNQENISNSPPMTFYPSEITPTENLNVASSFRSSLSGETTLSGFSAASNFSSTKNLKFSSASAGSASNLKSKITQQRKLPEQNTKSLSSFVNKPLSTLSDMLSITETTTLETTNLATCSETQKVPTDLLSLRLPYSSESCHTITKLLMNYNLVIFLNIYTHFK